MPSTKKNLRNENICPFVKILCNRNVAFVYLETESPRHKIFLQRIFMIPFLIKCATQFHSPKKYQEPLTATKLPQTELRILKLGKQ